MSFKINNTEFNILKNKDIIVKSYKNDYVVNFNKIDINQLLLNLYQYGDFIVMDRKIFELYNFKNCNFKYHLVDANESNKNIYSSLKIIDKLLDNNFNKSNKLIVIGGGIVQDISTMVSCIFKRGIKWIFIPTTLLAMCDSCIGAKSSINHGDAKNQLGVFYPPNEIYINTDFLKTLHLNDIKSGLGEIIKLFLLGGVDFMEKLVNLKTNLMEKLPNLIYDTLVIKKIVIEYDEFDKYERNALNYGHTIGHILEKLSNYEIPHGIAVFIGIKIINKLYNFKCKYIDNLSTFILKDYNISTLNLENLKELLLKDKKVKNNHINFIILKNYGHMIFKKEKITDDLIDKIVYIIKNL
jgi:3-dehydroquinate synthase